MHWPSSVVRTIQSVVALRQAAETGTDRDIKQARALFLKLRPADRKAALASLIE